jgi:hypothetical protein
VTLENVEVTVLKFADVIGPQKLDVVADNELVETILPINSLRSV